MLSAIAALEGGLQSPLEASPKYDVFYEGKRYAPKQVITEAYRIATGQPLLARDVQGGRAEGHAHDVLERLGFRILAKGDDPEAPRYWLMAAGERGSRWERFYREGIIAHDGSGIGRIEPFESREALARAAQQATGRDAPATNDARGMWAWQYQMQIGDVIIARRHQQTIVGVGVIRSTPRYVENGPDVFCHERTVEWLWRGDVRAPADEPQLPQWAVHNVDDRPHLRALADRLANLVPGRSAAASHGGLVPGQTYTRGDVRALLGLPPTVGGPWFTGYVQHHGEWYLFPNVGVAGRTGHDYQNRWEGPLLRWYGKNGTRVGQPAMTALLAPSAVVHLFSRTSDRDPFVYHGRVRAVNEPSGSPVEVVWEIVAPDRDLMEAAQTEEMAEGEVYREGAVVRVMVNARERDTRARHACVAHHGYACTVCGKTMEEMYGPVARGFIHVHHLHPMSEATGERAVDPRTDLRPVCPNCHAIIHLRRGPSYTVEEVRQMLSAAARPVRGPEVDSGASPVAVPHRRGS